MPEATPAPPPEATPAPTPEATPAPTPEATSAPTPEATPTPAPSSPVAPIQGITGQLTMWSDSATTVVGGSCEYANAASGGVNSPAATSPYIASRAYCAVDAA